MVETKLNKLINDLEKEMIDSREEDQFGYAKKSGPSIYHSVIKRLKELNVPEKVIDCTKMNTNEETLKELRKDYGEYKIDCEGMDSVLLEDVIDNISKSISQRRRNK